MQSSVNPSTIQENIFDVRHLSELVKENKIAEIKAIIEQRKKNASDWRNSWMSTDEDYFECALRDAILFQKMEIIELLLEEGMHINWINSTVSAPYLYFAAQTGNLELVKFLVERKGAAVNVKQADTPLKAAVKNGYTDIAAYLLEKGASIDHVFGKLKRHDTLLAHAAKHDRLQLFELIMQYANETTISTSIGLADQKYVNQIKKIETLFDTNDKAEIEKLNKLNEKYLKIFKTLMDHAFGVDLAFPEFLTPLKSAAGLNFIGVSLNGQPITRDRLKELGLKDIDKAIITEADLENLSDVERRSALKKRLGNAMQKNGRFVRKGIVNLVPLWRAAEIGDLETVKARLEAGIDPNVPGVRPEDVQKILPIVIAAANNHGAVINEIIKNAKFDKETLFAAIQAAQKNMHDQLAERLIETLDVNQFDAEGYTFLHRAIEAGEVTKVKSLIAKGADVNLKHKERSPLFLAVERSYSVWFAQPKKSSTEIIQALIDAGADPNVAYKQVTPMHEAGKRGNASAFGLLLPVTARNAFVCQDSNQNELLLPWYTPIMFDCLHSVEALAILKLLHESGANFNQLDHKKNCLLNAILNQVSYRWYNEVKPAADFVLEHGADPNQTADAQNNTALHEFLDYLLEDKIDLDDCCEVLDKCISKGFNINSANNKGETLLHICVSLYFQTIFHNLKEQSACQGMIKHLLKNHANASQQNKNGQTPLDYLQTQLSRLSMIDELKDENVKQWKQTLQEIRILLSNAMPKPLPEEKNSNNNVSSIGLFSNNTPQLSPPDKKQEQKKEHSYGLFCHAKNKKKSQPQKYSRRCTLV